MGFGDITISAAWAWVLAACAALITLAKVWEIVKGWGNGTVKRDVATLIKDNERLKERITALEALKVQDALDKDESRLKSLEEANVITMQTMLALVQHELDGNNVAGLRDTRDKLNKYLTQHLH